MKNDQHIWEGIVNGNADFLRHLHDKYYNQLWLWADRFINDKTLTEELVSDCFIKLWNHRKQIIIERSIKSYLYLMVRNRIISHLRSSKNKTEISIDLIPDIPDEAVMDDQEFYSELYDAINKIPEQRRRILELAVFESLTYKEIAAKLGISVNTVKTQMGRAYKFLKEELDPKSLILIQLLQPSSFKAY